MTIGGAIEDIKSWDIPFYCEKSREKVIETIVEAYQEGADSERPKAFSDGYESGYNKGRADATKWIPCSERLPEKAGNYLVSMKSETVSYMFFDCLYFYSVISNYAYKPVTDILAWMPLPEPYKEQNNGEDDELVNNFTELGYCHNGDIIRYYGDTYRVGHTDGRGLGWVNCTNVKTNKIKKIHIDSEVEQMKGEADETD